MIFLKKTGTKFQRGRDESAAIFDRKSKQVVGFLNGKHPKKTISLLYIYAGLENTLYLRELLDKNHIEYTEEPPGSRKAFAEMLGEDINRLTNLKSRLEGKVEE